MSSRFHLDAPQKVKDLLRELHRLSLDQEAQLAAKKDKAVDNRFVSTDILLQSRDRDGKETSSEKESKSFEDFVRDKFIALDEDKAEFMYQLIRAMGATKVIEAGTSFGVSTIYLALAVAENKKRYGGTGDGKHKPGVIATEKESSKAVKAREYWAECGPEIEGEIELREGDLLETLSRDVDQGVDLLLLDIWTPLALPTLKLVQPKLRPGAVVLTDNTQRAAEGYTELLEYFGGFQSGFSSVTLPYSGGFEMTVYNPK
ncbi:hypothetical protein D9757_003786 [Collybiopsis confluens]|uniref:O-methyltransferase n=1 Tax=Collybiopsis confluens TaxID=2823264 RepID=A0A8H5HVQ5_9AGAR|nr:hypothetical protein D9757_003786 [Collybiopsis confluens]